jgi:cell wall-associated NlpC family hydrolase
MHELALFANNRYRYASTGPDAYDCSGLIYRALVDLGYYKGVRFASATWGIQGAPIASKVTTPAVGDIVVWPGKHMGVVSGNDLMYSALNPTDGILESKISHESDHAGFQPSYWRLKG